MHNPIPIKNTTHTDHTPPNTTHSDSSAVLYVFDNEAVIKMIIKSEVHNEACSRTHRAALDWLFDKIHFGPQIQIRFDTKHQLADMLTEGNVKRDEWNQSSSFVQYQPFQLHLLHHEFQLEKLLLNGEEDSRSKRRKSCVQVATSNDEYVFFYCDKFFFRI